MRGEFGDFSDPGLPPGCRPADLERRAGILDDLSPAQLWRRLADHQQAQLYRDFFRSEWGELSACLSEQAESAGPTDSGLLTMAKATCDLWLRWRDRAVLRMLQAGEIPSVR
jgi:hypothetical protein